MRKVWGTTAQLLILPYPASFVFAFALFRSLSPPSSEKAASRRCILAPHEAVSGTLGAALSHPADTLKTRLQAGASWLTRCDRTDGLGRADCAGPVSRWAIGECLIWSLTCWVTVMDGYGILIGDDES